MQSISSLKRLTLTLVGGLVLTAISLGGTPGWLLSYDKAQEFAKKSGRPVLVNFTGSDWCGWCIKMKKDVLSKPEFIQYASSNLILLELDFPQKTPQTAELKAANEALKQRFKITGFPTFILVDPNGKVLGRQVGYLQGGVEAFTDKITSWKGVTPAAAVPAETAKAPTP